MVNDPTTRVDDSSSTPDIVPTTQPSNRALRKVAVSSLLGTTIEYYDFLLYSTMAALVFGSLYFPDSGDGVATIAAFGTLAAGYVARPVGGILFGHFGDRLGRKKTLVTSMLLMGIASTLIGLIPTYDAIGVAAPIILVLLRTVQGIAVGGEYGGAALMVIEHADPRRRGTWVGVMQLGSPLGSILSTLAIAAVTLLPDDEFMAWGWRVPFLLSAGLLAIGLYIRLSVVESPVFQQAAAAAQDVQRRRIPFVEVIRDGRTLALACAVGIGPFALTALISSYMVAYATTIIGFSRSSVMQALLFSTAVSVVFIPLFSAISDHVGRRPVVLVGAIGAVSFAWPMYTMVDTGSLTLLVLAMITGQTLQNLMYAPLAPMLSEMFGTSVRYTGVSLGYQLASLLGAGFTPLIAAALVTGTGGSSVPLMSIMAGAATITLVALALLPESRGTDLTAQPPQA